MLRRLSAHLLVAVGLLLSVATSQEEPDYGAEATSESVSVDGGALASTAPILLRVTVGVEGTFYTEDDDGTITELAPTAELNVAFPGDWTAEDGGTVELYLGRERSCAGSGGTGSHAAVPGDGDRHSPPPYVDGFIEASGTTLVLVHVTGDPVYVGSLVLTATLDTGSTPSRVKGDLTVHLAAEVLPLDCRVEPEAADTADDTADTATP
jgi:hypothetical protein